MDKQKIIDACINDIASMYRQGAYDAAEFERFNNDLVAAKTTHDTRIICDQYKYRILSRCQALKS